MKIHSLPLNVEKKASALQELIENATSISNNNGYAPGKHISNSFLSMLKRHLTGVNQFYGNEAHLKFGSELHKRFLQPRRKKDWLPADQELILDSMVKRLKQNNFVKTFLSDSVNEKICVKSWFDQRIKVIIDAERKGTIIDLKTTSCTSFQAFIHSAISYGYFRQAAIYSGVRNAKEFFFVGVSKKPPHDIFIINVNEFPDLLRDGTDEAMHLITVYKTLSNYYENQRETSNP